MERKLLAVDASQMPPRCGMRTSAANICARLQMLMQVIDNRLHSAVTLALTL
jgi:hypothetical protein